MGWKEFKEEYKQEVTKEKMKQESKRQAKREIREAKPKPTEQEKFYKTGNTIIKGVMWYYMIPVIGFILIVGVVLAFAIYDWFISLF
jgi:hypothetical protein